MYCLTRRPAFSTPLPQSTASPGTFQAAITAVSYSPEAGRMPRPPKSPAIYDAEMPASLGGYAATNPDSGVTAGQRFIAS